MQKTGKNRNTIDKFYTNPSIVDKYIEKFKPYLGNKDLIIEPSAGSGVWTSPLHMYNLIAFDIQPEGEGIQQMNFLYVDLWAFNVPNPNIVASTKDKFLFNIFLSSLLPRCDSPPLGKAILPSRLDAITIVTLGRLKFEQLMNFQDSFVENFV